MVGLLAYIHAGVETHQAVVAAQASPMMIEGRPDDFFMLDILLYVSEKVARPMLDLHQFRVFLLRSP